jgi:Ras-related protein Rab-5C
MLSIPMESGGPLEPTALKVVVIGNSGTGKTSLVHRATCDFYNDSPSTTLGASFSSLHVIVEGQEFKLQIWDTAGQEKYRSMTPMYYRGAQAAVVVYAIDELQSFEGVDFWLQSLQTHGDPGIIVLLCGNKCDRAGARTVPMENGRERGALAGARFMEVSARTGEGVADLFREVGLAYLESRLSPAKGLPESEVGVGKGRPKVLPCCR